MSSTEAPVSMGIPKSAARSPQTAGDHQLLERGAAAGSQSADDREGVNSSYLPVIALDGPSGTGKSTVAQALARRLGLRYLDTGAMYRAATVAVLDAGVELDDAVAVATAVAGSDIQVSTDLADRNTYLGSRAVSQEIRGEAVTLAVSKVSAVPAVRAQLVAAQRDLIGSGGIVVEGRDIGSVVWPQAAPKIYLTADEEVRAQRRSRQLAKGDPIEAVRRDLERRDAFDSSRRTSPLTRTDDAVEVDTTYLSIDEVVNVLVDLCVNDRPILSGPGRRG
ncbi:cytidylate kinase [Jatrophihabitans sp. GAS493]|uniref:(d)CMP kinase n=1 Tax=Jatrophihabitans sp. GAS493 TaxID=1907575 RepID=UPI000BBFC7D6|nr:(d)CMP kinase [Jatrophihabitans sp. GAS493]SOD73810.1 cytidylate kinase [Jatrophihabitans sp. GAS493]